MTETCDYCRLPIDGGYHSADWCLEWTGPERIVRVPIAGSAFTAATQVEPALTRGRIAVCAIDGCRGQSAPGYLRCPSCLRQLEAK